MITGREAFQLFIPDIFALLILHVGEMAVVAVTLQTTNFFFHNVWGSFTSNVLKAI